MLNLTKESSTAPASDESTTSLHNSPSPRVPFQPASLDIWEKKYQLTDKFGTAIDHDIDASYQRVALAISAVETDKREYWYEEFLWALRNGAIPAGRIMSNAGADAYKPKTSLINCTVSNTIQDDMQSILQCVLEAGLTLKAGCGIGFEHSTLRPSGAFVAGAGASTSGPLPFMEIFNASCKTISSAGGRRGAQMGTFDVQHPDVLDFITAKHEDGRLSQFNLSLLISDDFINAVKNDLDWKLCFPVMRSELAEVDFDDSEQVIWREWPNHDDKYTIRDDGLVACKVYKSIKAKKLWSLVMSSTYDFAEPGFIMIDRVNENNNNWFCENIRATNP